MNHIAEEQDPVYESPFPSSPTPSTTNVLSINRHTTYPIIRSHHYDPTTTTTTLPSSSSVHHHQYNPSSTPIMMETYDYNDDDDDAAAAHNYNSHHAEQVVSLIDDHNHTMNHENRRAPFVLQQQQQQQQQYNQPTAPPLKKSGDNACFLNTGIILTVLCLLCCCCCLVVPIVVIKIVASGYQKLTHCTKSSDFKFGDTVSMQIPLQQQLQQQQNTVTLKFHGFGEYEFVRNNMQSDHVLITETRKSKSTTGFKNIRSAWTSNSNDVIAAALQFHEPMVYTIETTIDQKNKEDCYSSRMLISVPNDVSITVETTSGSIKFNSKNGNMRFNVLNAIGDRLVDVDSVTTVHGTYLTSSRGIKVKNSMSEKEMILTSGEKSGSGLIEYQHVSTPRLVIRASSSASVSGKDVNLIRSGELISETVYGQQVHKQIRNAQTIRSTSRSGSISMVLDDDDWSGQFTLESKSSATLVVSSSLQDRVVRTVDEPKIVRGFYNGTATTQQGSLNLSSDSAVNLEIQT